MSIIGFIGRQRQGKTLLMNVFAKYYQKRGYTIVTNQRDVSYPHVYFNRDYLVSKDGIEDLKRKLNTKHIILCLDEAHLWLDSRRSRKNTAKSFLISQAGKMLGEGGAEGSGHFLYTTQFFGQIDVRLRYNTSYVFSISKHEDDDSTQFRVLTMEPRGEWMEQTNETWFDSSELYEDGMYNRFEMIDVED